MSLWGVSVPNTSMEKYFCWVQGVGSNSSTFFSYYLLPPTTSCNYLLSLHLLACKLHQSGAPHFLPCVITAETVPGS